MGGSSITTQTSEPFSGQRNTDYNSLYQYLQDKLNNPQSYSGQLTTPTTTATQQGITGLASAADNPTLQAFASGQNLDPSSNTYLQGAINALKQNSVDQFGQEAKAIDTHIAPHSFWDSSGHSAALTNAANQSNQNFSNAVADMEANQYNTNVGQMMNAEGALQGANTALAGAGNSEWNQENTNLGQLYQAWKDQTGLSDQDITNLLQYFNIGKNPTTTSTTDSDPGIGGILGSLAGGWASTWKK